MGHCEPNPFHMAWQIAATSQTSSQTCLAATADAMSSTPAARDPRFRRNAERDTDQGQGAMCRSLTPRQSLAPVAASALGQWHRPLASTPGRMALASDTTGSAKLVQAQVSIGGGQRRPILTCISCGLEFRNIRIQRADAGASQMLDLCRRSSVVALRWRLIPTMAPRRWWRCHADGVMFSMLCARVPPTCRGMVSVVRRATLLMPMPRRPW